MWIKDSGRIAFSAPGESQDMYIPEVETVGFTFVGSSASPQYKLEGGRYDEDTDTIQWVTLHDTGAITADDEYEQDMTTYTHGRVTLVSSSGGGELYYCRAWRE